MRAPTEERTYTVSEITRLIKANLEEGFPAVAVQGEVSNCRPSSTGHLYFSLKDRDSLLSAVMFRSRYATLSFRVADGMLVKAWGEISVYEKRGTYQLVCERLAPAGEGDILAMLEERKRRLAAEGLFDEARKRRLPLLPSRVAVVTSPTGAAIRDILRVLARRGAGIDIMILPTPVQGEGAEERIAAQIEAANRWSLGEVIIVGRGGGSLEDLLPFSAEAVVRAIASSRIPVISAVGHEVDWTLADLAADVRAPTPSAAAEMVTAAQAELASKVAGLAQTIGDALRSRLQRCRLVLERLDVQSLEHFVRLKLQSLSQRFDDARDAMAEELGRVTRDARHRLELASRELASCSPLAVLARGYAVVTAESTGAVLLSSEGLERGDGLLVRLARGGLSAAVKETYASKEL